MIPRKRELKPAPLIHHPAFSTESSDTEYTSEEEVDHETCVEPRNPTEEVPATPPSLEPAPVNMAISPAKELVQNGKEVMQSVACFPRKASSLKEQYVVDKHGKCIVVVDLGDSEDEAEAPPKRPGPLCTSCLGHGKHHEPHVTKAREKDEVRMQIVVDISSQVGGVQKGETSHGVMAPFLVKANGRQVEAEASLSREKVRSVKANGGLVEAETKVTLHSRTLVGKVRETVAEESEDEASTLSDDYRRGHAEGHHVEMITPDWSLGVVCDLCERGASLSLGAWYSWCCGNPSLGCSCSFDNRLRKKKALMGKGGKNWKTTDPPYPWSGMVHKLCGLWSAEVFEDSKQPWRIMKLGDAVRRSRKIKCSDPDCGLFGATLGCRVVSCKRSFHYPCADRLSALVKVRMWDGLMKPVACKEHRHVEDVFDDVKLQRETKKEVKKRKRKKQLFTSSVAGSTSKVGVIEIESSDEEESPRVASTRPLDTSDSRNGGAAYFGKNLLCLDFSGGHEPITVPCTNDVDLEEPPYLEYITKSRYGGQPLSSKNCPFPLLERQAKACDGCARHDPDDPSAPLSVHIPFQRREDDYREDWLRERMYGRLPYDKFARLVIGTDYNELVECNDRCKCGDRCINREMQKGLRTPIELYKTVNKGWAVRTLVPIPRGRFVIEYVGEMLGQDKAQKYGQIYDDLKRSYLYDLDYPESKRTPDFTLDGFHASNVARFINHSCDANLKIYRVYVETTYKWLSHIGMYAMRDIEPGEELSYDYNYGRHDLQAHDGKAHGAEARKQKLLEQQNDSTHIKCYCGAKNCREWLWRPMHTGDDSEED